MEPLTLATLTGAVLSQGITFLYGQAGEILRGWRERRAGSEADAVVPVASSSVVAGPLEPVVPDWAVVEALEADLRELRRELSDYVAGGLDEPDPADEPLLRRVDALRRAVEVVLGQRVTFVGEDRPESGPVVTGSVEVTNVHGYVAAVRSGQIAQGRVEGRVDVGTVHEGGQVVGVDVDRIGPGGRGE